MATGAAAATPVATGAARIAFPAPGVLAALRIVASLIALLATLPATGAGCQPPDVVAPPPKPALAPALAPSLLGVGMAELDRVDMMLFWIGDANAALGSGEVMRGVPTGGTYARRGGLRPRGAGEISGWYVELTLPCIWECVKSWRALPAVVCLHTITCHLWPHFAQAQSHNAQIRDQHSPTWWPAQCNT